MWEGVLLEITHPGPPHQELFSCAGDDGHRREILFDFVDVALLSLVEEIDRRSKLDEHDVKRRGPLLRVFTSRPPVRTSTADHARLLAMILSDLMRDPEWPDGLCGSPALMTRFLLGVGLSHPRWFCARGWPAQMHWLFEEMLVCLEWEGGASMNPWTLAKRADALEFALGAAV